MTLSSTNRVQVAYVQESSWGVVPVTGNGKYLRLQSETLDFSLTKQSDKEIRSDRQVVSSTTVNATMQGDIKVHMQYAEYDPLLLALLQTTDSASMFGVNGVGASFTSTITTTTLTASAPTTGVSAFTNLQPGQWFRFNLTGDVNDGKYFRNSVTVPATSTVITFDTNTPGVAGGGATSTISAYRMTNGTTPTSFTLERAVTDASPELFFSYQGAQPSKFVCTFTSGALTDATFSFMGKNLITPTNTSNLPGTAAASQTYQVQNAVKGVGFVWENGVPLTGSYIKKLDMTIDNQLRVQDAISNLGAVGLGTGTLKISGTFDLYLANASIYTKYLTDTFTSLSVSTKDSSGNGYVITFPKINITKATTNATGQNADMMLTCSYDVLADITNSVTALRQSVFIDRLGAANAISFA